jgi:hypothetical protein
MLEKPITFGPPNGFCGDVVPSLRSLIEDKETTTYGAPSGAASLSS